MDCFIYHNKHREEKGVKHAGVGEGGRLCIRAYFPRRGEKNEAFYIST